ncbi:hypothetical protein ALC53_12320 [Atta colombica]|uniref:Uncharacterized protein n=1 Tax=Atta colombica TaxID=520822 RepID=A0A195AZF4_9HYME|nr:hypothetical protein ALC53_12320 [Atta colombica]
MRSVRRLTIVVDAPLLRQPFISGSTLAATNVSSQIQDWWILVKAWESDRDLSMVHRPWLRYGSGNVVKIH